MAATFYSARINCERAATAASMALGAERYTDLRAAGRTRGLVSAVALAKAVANRVEQSSNTGRHGSVPALIDLTPREVDVSRLLVAGRSDRQIGTALFIGHRTAQDHVSNVIRKLSVANRTEAAAVAVRDGLV